MGIPILLLLQLAINASVQQTTTSTHVDESGFILINGMEQWVTIRGDHSKPAILFLHGGPGSPISPYAKAVYKNWEKDFLIVQWDQRGTGKTFGHNAPAALTPAYLKSNPLTIDQMCSDGIELTKYLLAHLGKQKIVLFGTSWGSILGVKMATSHPELFYAYIAHSQMVNPAKTTKDAYYAIYKRAQAAHDKKSVDILTEIGPPPYDLAQNLGQLMRIVKQYQARNTTPAPDAWWQFPKEYNGEDDHQHRSDGDDYSFVNYAGDKNLDLKSMVETVDFLNANYTFQIPVFMIQGREDIQTPETSTREYFNKIVAPQKKYFLLKKTDHGFNQAVADIQFHIMTKYILPLIP